MGHPKERFAHRHEPGALSAKHGSKPANYSHVSMEIRKADKRQVRVQQTELCSFTGIWPPPDRGRPRSCRRAPALREGSPSADGKRFRLGGAMLRPWSGFDPTELPRAFFSALFPVSGHRGDGWWPPDEGRPLVLRMYQQVLLGSPAPRGGAEQREGVETEMSRGLQPARFCVINHPVGFFPMNLWETLTRKCL